MACLEAKGTSTAGLFAPRRRAKMGHYTLVRQTRDGMGISGAERGARGGWGCLAQITVGLGHARRRMPCLGAPGERSA